MKMLMTLVFFVFAQISFSFPGPPQDPQHPGYPTRSVKVKKVVVNYLRKGSVLYLPSNSNQKIPLVVFSHGQALKLKHYELLFERLASRGIAVLYPQYDKGFFDTDWERMGEDYDKLTQFVLDNFPEIDKNEIIYSGHSKGGYVGLMALGHRGSQSNVGNSLWSPKTAIFYSPAGYSEQALLEINPRVDVHLVWPKGDGVIKESLIDEIFQLLPNIRKQKIIVQGYDDLEAGHFFPLTKKSLFGGEDGIGPFHYYGVLPWTLGAIKDDDFLYGELVTDSGDEKKPHVVLRNF